MIKKVALVSFFKSENYGAVLQSVGLQRVLRNNGIDAYYLDYERKLELSPIRRIAHCGYMFFRVLFGYGKRRKRTILFRKRYLTSCTFTKENDYDLYIVGSDQVWMPDYVNDFFLLKFIKKKHKMSYASSFGVQNIPDSIRKQYTDALRSFSAISTRERSGLGILQSLGFVKSKLVLDPTLLLHKEEWEEMTIPPQLKTRYILCYVMNGDEETAKHVHNVANRLNANNSNRFSVLTIGDKEYKSILAGYNLVCDAGPSEFLGYILNADYIVTSSFHGTCFSILFKKNYVNILRPDNPVNCRIEDLGSMLDLGDRIYYTDALDIMPDFAPIEYGKVERLLAKYRNESLNYLLGTIDLLGKQ